MNFALLVLPIGAVSVLLLGFQARNTNIRYSGSTSRDKNERTGTIGQGVRAISRFPSEHKIVWIDHIESSAISIPVQISSASCLKARRTGHSLNLEIRRANWNGSRWNEI
jgi:hypothetical protein